MSGIGRCGRSTCGPEVLRDAAHIRLAGPDARRPHQVVAEYVGTSVEMIERHYGRYLGADTASQLALLDGEGREAPLRSGRRDSSEKRGSSRVWAGNLGYSGVAQAADQR